jgi:hypothetical protein
MFIPFYTESPMMFKIRRASRLMSRLISITPTKRPHGKYRGFKGREPTVVCQEIRDTSPDLIPSFGLDGVSYKFKPHFYIIFH